MKRVVLVNGNEWQGLYIDGQLKMEASIISAYQALHIFSESHDFQLDTLVADEEWLEQRGCFPEMLSDLQEEKQ